MGARTRGCVGFCSVRWLCWCRFLLYFFSFTTFPRNAGERDLGCYRGALAVAHGTAGGANAHGRDRDDVGHAHELVSGDEAPDDRQDLQDGSDNVDFDCVRHDRLRGGVCWTYRCREPQHAEGL